jgi:hypothetical protein
MAELTIRLSDWDTLNGIATEVEALAALIGECEDPSPPTMQGIASMLDRHALVLHSISANIATDRDARGAARSSG